MIEKIVRYSPRVANFFPLILIVEEDDDTRLMLKYLLEIWKYRVLVAIDAEDIVLAATRHRPELILINIKMPNLEGLRIGRRLRKLECLEKTIIIYVSASNNAQIRCAATNAGGNDFLSKPIDFGLLESRLETHLNRVFRLKSVNNSPE